MCLYTIAALPLFAIGLVNGGTRSISTTVTPSNPTTSVAKISLVEDGDKSTVNSISTTTNSYVSTTSGLSDAFGVELEIFNSKCDGIETIDIDVYGGPVDGDVDQMFVFSLKNSNGIYDYFSYLHNWTPSRLTTLQDENNIGGLFIAPACNSNNIFSYNKGNEWIDTLYNDTINNTNSYGNYTNYINDTDYTTSSEWIDTMLDDLNSNGEYSKKGYAHRSALAGGDYNNYYRLTESKSILVEPSVSPIRFTIINDLLNHQITTSFKTPALEKDCNFNTVFDTASGNNYIVGFGTDHGTVEYSQFDVTVTCFSPTNNPTTIPTTQPTAPTAAPTPACDYTHECKAVGDPHITSFDNTLYHFQGDGYFDYVKSCNGGDLTLPFTLSAKHYQCRSTRTCIGEVIVKLNDGDNKMISFPSKGTPIFINDNSVSNGEYSFLDGNNYNQLVEYKVSQYNFEIKFVDNNGKIAMLKFYYKGKTLKITTTNCLFGSKHLCGLCGNINDYPVDDFIRCDNNDMIDNTNSASSFSGTPWENTHIFGESCCNKELDNIFIGSSDCGTVISPPEEIDDFCLLVGQSICENFYDSYCKECETDEGATQEWIDSCAFDMCADVECQSNVLQGTFTVEQLINNKCLENSVDDCAAPIMEKFQALGYQL